MAKLVAPSALLGHLVVLLALLGIGCGVHRHPPQDPTIALEHFTAVTEDGWALGISHVPARNVRYANPVLLVHGMGSNRHSFDAVPDGSLAPFLAARGWDVWMLDLRGHGDSERPRWPRRKHDWVFDVYAQRDIPAAIDFIKGQTGADALFYVGHSMGGMAGHQYLGSERGTGVAGFVAVASPVSFQEPERFYRIGDRIRPFFFDHTVRGHWVRHFAWMNGYHAPGFLHWWLWNPANLSRDERKPVMRWAADDVFRGELREAQVWGHEGAMCSYDGQTSFAQNLGRIDVPVFLLAGSVDHIVPPERVIGAIPYLKTPDLTVRVFGRANGYHHDYGHVDIILGRNAAAEVFPAIEAWMAAHAHPAK